MSGFEKLEEDMMLNSRFTNSSVVTDLGGKTNQYGERRNIEAVLKANMASEIVQFVKGGDQEVAKGIAVGIELGKPTYGELGEEFLREKNPDYKKSGLGVALTKVMLAGLSGERVDKILREVEKVLEGEEEISEEAKAAKIAHRIYHAANKRKDRNMFNTILTMALGKVFRATRANGTVSHVDYLDKIDEKEPEKDIIVRNPQQKEEFERAFSYYDTNYSEIPEKFTTALDGYRKESIVAYYVASMKENNLRRM